MGHHDSLRHPGPQRRLLLELERGINRLHYTLTPQDTCEVSWRVDQLPKDRTSSLRHSFPTAPSRTGICGRGSLNRYPGPPGTRPAALSARSGSWSIRAGALAAITLRHGGPAVCMPPAARNGDGSFTTSIAGTFGPGRKSSNGRPGSPDLPGGPAYGGRPHPQRAAQPGTGRSGSLRSPALRPGRPATVRGEVPVIFLATDSDDMIQAMRDEFGPAVVYQTDVLRTPAGEDEQLHFFRREDVRFGQDVLSDGLLLAACDRLIHVTSNVATAVALFNPDLDLHYIGRFEPVPASSGIRSGGPCATRDAARGGSRLKPSMPASGTTSPTRCSLRAPGWHGRMSPPQSPAVGDLPRAAFGGLRELGNRVNVFGKGENRAERKTTGRSWASARCRGAGSPWPRLVQNPPRSLSAADT